MNLLFAINRKFISLLLSCLHSISLRGGDSLYQAYILSSGLSCEDEAFIRANAEKNMVFHFVPVPQELFEGFPKTGRYPTEIFYRLAAPALLSAELERVLYLDADTIVINPLKRLYEIDFEGNCFAACTHTREFLRRANLARIRADGDWPYVNTGVMMMNLPALREHLDLRAIRDFALANRRRMLLPDQDVLTALYGDRVKIIDSLLYNMNDRVLFFHNAEPQSAKLDESWVRDNSVIIHYFGNNKPWKKHYIGALGEFYHEYGLPITEDSPKDCDI